MKTYYFGNMEFGTATIHSNTFEFCLVHEIEEVRQFASIKEAEMFAEANDLGDYTEAYPEGIEIVFSEACLWNGSIEINPLLESKDDV